MLWITKMCRQAPHACLAGIAIIGWLVLAVLLYAAFANWYRPFTLIILGK